MFELKICTSVIGVLILCFEFGGVPNDYIYHERIDSESQLEVMGLKRILGRILLQLQGENILVSPAFKESRIQQSTKPIGSAIPWHIVPVLALCV